MAAVVADCSSWQQDRWCVAHATGGMATTGAEAEHEAHTHIAFMRFASLAARPPHLCLQTSSPPVRIGPFALSRNRHGGHHRCRRCGWRRRARDRRRLARGARGACEEGVGRQTQAPAHIVLGTTCTFEHRCLCAYLILLCVFVYAFACYARMVTWDFAGPVNTSARPARCQIQSWRIGVGQTGSEGATPVS